MIEREQIQFRNRAYVSFVAVLTLGLLSIPSGALAQSEEEAGPEPTLFVREYRVIGSKKLSRDSIEMAVYPYLGPERTARDVEGARSALEQAYRDEGYQTVNVSVPLQKANKGIIFLQVSEMTVGRLRVNGSRFYDINKIKGRVPSLAEGNLPKFSEVERDMIALNQSGDLQVTPSLKPGVVPGTVDVDLAVKDQLPLHGSVELNNRYSANTTPLRLDLSLRYDNLWQLGHTAGFGFQIAPQRVSDALIYSGFYIAPVPGVEWLSVMAQAIRQNSNVSTLGGTAVAGNGEVIGGRLLFTLPRRPGFFQTAGFGLDYKHFTQDLTIGGETVGSPITYWPFVASYNAVWLGAQYEINLDAAFTFHFRGMGSTEVEFDNRRYEADGNFYYLRGSLSGLRELPLGFQVYGLIQGQASPVSLVDSEQFSMGGLNTVRGYLESSVLGDSAVAGSVEFRSPSLLSWVRGSGHEWRIFGFLDAGSAYVNNPLPEQTSQFDLVGAGVGSTLQLFQHINGEVIFGVPFISQGSSTAFDPLLSFRIWGEL